MLSMLKIDQIHLRAVMLCMSKIDQIHLRAVMLCMSEMSKMSKIDQIHLKTLPTNDFELTFPDLYPYVKLWKNSCLFSYIKFIPIYSTDILSSICLEEENEHFTNCVKCYFLNKNNSPTFDRLSWCWLFLGNKHNSPTFDRLSWCWLFLANKNWLAGRFETSKNVKSWETFFQQSITEKRFF